MESQKGERKLTRKARRRGGKASSAGLSAEQVPVLIAVDRNGNRVDGVLPDRSEASVSAVLDSVVSKTETLLCMDGDKALIAFATKRGIEYELIIASRGEHVHESVLHIQNVNNYMSRFRRWLTPFNGVATKYLPSYLGWMRILAKPHAKPTPNRSMAAALI